MVEKNKEKERKKWGRKRNKGERKEEEVKSGKEK